MLHAIFNVYIYACGDDTDAAYCTYNPIAIYITFVEIYIIYIQLTYVLCST